MTAIFAVTALCVGAAGPVGAQNIADLPRLGYAIDPHEGFVGDEVHSQVNVDDVNEHCWDSALSSLTGQELGALIAAGDVSFEEFLTIFAVEIWTYVAPGDVYWFGLPNLAPAFGLSLAEAQAIWQSIYGPPPADSADNPIANFVREDRPPPAGIPDDPDGQLFVERVGDIFGLAFASFGIAELAPALYPQVFITTFVDPVTQELLGDTGNFDPGTGAGTMTVSELDPGVYAVVAACVLFPSPEEFMANWDDALVAAWDYGVACEAEGGELCFPGGSEWAAAGGFAALLPSLFAPRAIGLDFYCVLDADGACHPDLRDLTLAELEALEDDGLLGELLGDDLPATPVGASPRFTG